ncbi:hypothetical protein GCM10010331_49720 [Streptomyces xanthochromogenes]|uniref:hypothetical protein n=1 Tax=Streptomyces xanthochromogenes TaxID=67384 RepID=UPI00167A144D|nr:hypothetical protein [Streptomyces xanthochromogenes]GHB55905.1 hypothetical protein GCM10010331_49720 [Streptomyces xanthochromogenes]
MARIRSIKPEFFTSLTIADLTSEQRLTFIGLWTHVDDEGRCVDDSRLIKAALWPLDDRTALDIEGDLGALSESSLIARYTLNQRRYLAVTGWAEHQKINRPTPSKIPPPPKAPILGATCGDEDSSTPHGGVSEDSLAERKGTGKGKEQGTGKGNPPSAARTPPDPGPAFDEFWTRYPRKAGKSEAAKAWIKATQAGADPDALLAAVKAHADYHVAAKTEQQFIPHASTWLNQKRFEDDVPSLPRPAGPAPAPRDMTDEEKKNALKFG